MIERKAKNFKIKEFDNFQLDVGMINKENPKSIYFNLRGFVKSIDTNYRQNIRKFLKSIENTVERNIDKTLFNEKFILVWDYPTTMIDNGAGFITLECNLYLKNSNDFIIEPYLERIETLVEKIDLENFQHSSLFEMRRTKKNKS
jgi:hypothetical protein